MAFQLVTFHRPPIPADCTSPLTCASVNTAMNSPAILVQNLSVSIDSKPILINVSVSLEPGRFLTIIGPNGAGKSTLLRCIGSLHKPFSGSIAIAGRPIAGYSRRDLAKCISYVPQSGDRGFPYTVHEFVMMSRYPHLRSFFTVSRTDRDAVARALAEAELESFAQRRIDTLSGGERQKVFIAAALAQGAPIVLLDEPTTFLDYRQAAGILDLIRRMNRSSGITVISVTHDINQALDCCDWILALKDGHAVFSGPPASLLSAGTLDRIFDLPFEILTDPSPRIFPKRPIP